MKEETIAWMGKAEDDYDTMSILHHHGRYNGSCYHAQQSSEKYVKSIFSELQLDIPRTHNILKLLLTLSTEGILLTEDLIEAATYLTGFATISRYPGYDSTLEDSENCLEASRLIKDIVLNYFIINNTTKPTSSGSGQEEQQ